MRFRQHPQRITGSIAPLITPILADGAIDHDRLRALVDWQLCAGSHGISLGGSTGEPSSQTIEERASAIRTVAKEVADRVPFMPGTGSANLEDTLTLTAHAADVGADAVLIITPYYARPTQDGLYQWYSTVAQEFPYLPIVAYNVPSRTAVGLAPETIARLFREFDNFVGVKETTTDFEHFSRTLHAAGPELLVWSGIERLCLPALTLGAVGFISAVSNIAPTAVAQMYENYEAGDLRAARQIHYGLHPLVDLLFIETNPAPVKWLMHQRGLLSSPDVRPPLSPLSEVGRARVSALAGQGAAYLTAAPALPTAATPGAVL
ncbi:4-hydroxy-tetrahydrodipicolinate synthase [Mycobacterium sp. 134]|uniref:4-hydroxy-tetrahydrodipicolinate synthase n=1 Tax=Mycobacterium sp. 134 TaxID=3400425 RepID=UPI003AAD648C